MREILFRGKRKDNGEWVYGYFVKAADYLYTDKTVHVILPLSTVLYPHGEFDEIVEIIPETLGQWIGLCDKNGTKIFEGDVVKYQIGSDYILGRIGWNETHLAYTILVITDTRLYYYIDEGLGSDMEVIGNIHDNPELME